MTITSCDFPHLRFLAATTLACRRYADVLELHYFIAGEGDHQLKVAAERADVFAQGRQLHVCPSFEAGNVDLTADQAPCNLFLGDLLCLPETLKGILFEDQFSGALLDPPLTLGRKRCEYLLV